MSKSTKGTSSRMNSETKSRENAAFLKIRVQELEAEVSSLKKRLDGLRKAKNSTVIKKEKEYVAMGASETNRSKRPSIPEDKNYELHKKMKDLSLQHSDEMDGLKKKHEADLKRLQDERPPTPEKCNHEEEILRLNGEVTQLQDKNKDLSETNDALHAENVALHNKFEELFTELSLKEAQWCEKEEQLNLKLKLQWGEKYREWMEATENKIAELQKANDYLRTCLKSPSGN